MESRALVALLLVLAVLVACGGETPRSAEFSADVGTSVDADSAGLGGIDIPTDDDPQTLPPHPDKDTLDSAPHCENWRTAIADEIDRPAPWGLGQEGVVSENVRAFFAAQHPIDGRDYLPCVLADIFDEIELHVEVLREAYFALAPEAQLARSELPLFLGFLYEEPATVPLLIDIAVQPLPDFDPEYVSAMTEAEVMAAEADVRVAAVMAISDSAPRQGDMQAWIDALYRVIIDCEVDGVPLVATWQLRQKGVTEEEFAARLSGEISDDELSYLRAHGWQ